MVLDCKKGLNTCKNDACFVHYCISHCLRFFDEISLQKQSLQVLSAKFDCFRGSRVCCFVGRRVFAKCVLILEISAPPERRLRVAVNSGKSSESSAQRNSRIGKRDCSAQRRTSGRTECAIRERREKRVRMLGFIWLSSWQLGA